MKKMIIVALLVMNAAAHAQNLLDKTISLEVNRQRIDHVLEILSNKGNFYFSYNSNIIKKDSLVSFVANGKTVLEILRIMLPGHYEFRESGNYIIIRKAPIRVTVITKKAVAEDKFYSISGYVLDDNTGYWINNASIYEPRLLISTLTNTGGFFKLRFKKKTGKLELVVSKHFYRDTSFMVDAGFNQEVSVTLIPETYSSNTIVSPDDYFVPDHLKEQDEDSADVQPVDVRSDSFNVERTRMGSWLINSKQKIQGINLRKFFTTRPFQVSFTPGLGSHGYLSAQVVNNFSLNILGGYNGGVNGAEIGGLFNINKKDVKYFQAAGVFNINGGKTSGFQVAGVHNTVLDSVKGFQAAGVSNFVKGRFGGMQVGGVYNHVTGSMKGAQIAGVGNFSKQDVHGLQVGGVFNFANKTMNGVQVGGVINYAKKLRGVQVGLINISDSSEGVSIGLLNFVLKGYHKLSFYSDEMVNANVAFKTGHKGFYNILQAGMNFSENKEVFTFGYGFGSEIGLGKVFSLNPEFTLQHLYLGSWDYANLLGKAKLNVNIKLGRYVSIFGGPVFNGYHSHQDVQIPGYRSAIPPSGNKVFNLGYDIRGWWGWNAGINFF